MGLQVMSTSTLNQVTSDKHTGNGAQLPRGGAWFPCDETWVLSVVWAMEQLQCHQGWTLAKRRGKQERFTNDGGRWLLHERSMSTSLLYCFHLRVHKRERSNNRKFCRLLVSCKRILRGTSWPYGNTFDLTGIITWCDRWIKGRHPDILGMQRGTE